MSLNTKLLLSALGIVAMLTTPAAAQYMHRVTPAGQSVTYNEMPGYNGGGSTVWIPNPDRLGGQRLYPASRSAIYDVMPGSYDVMPGYDSNGVTVSIPNSDRFGVQSQR